MNGCRPSNYNSSQDLSRGFPRGGGKSVLEFHNPRNINSTAQQNLVGPTVRFGVSRQSITTSKPSTGLQETYMVAAVAGEGEEVDLVAVADAAVLSQVGELRRAHPAEPLRENLGPARASRCRHRRSGRKGEGNWKRGAGGGLGRQTDGTRIE